MKPRRIIVIHSSATDPDHDCDVDEIRRWHTDPKPKGRGWSDIGYHSVIKRDGTHQYGRKLHRVPASVRGWNAGTIAICMVGGVDKKKRPQNNFTVKQIDSLIRTIERYRQSYDVVSIVGHKDFPGTNTDCPSFNVHGFVYRNFLT